MRCALIAVLASLLACGSDAGEVIFVDAAAPPGGDGSRDHPYQSIAEALADGGDHSIVAIAAGDYPVPATFDFERSLRFQGSIDAATTLLTEGDPTAAFDWGAGAGVELSLFDLGLASPMRLSGGSLEVQNVASSGATGPAIHLIDADVELFDLEISGVVEIEGGGETGDGLLLEGGTALWRGGGTTDIPDRAVIVRGGTATLEDLTLTSANRGAITADNGGAAEAIDVAVSGGRIGAFVSSASLTLTGATVSGASTSGVLTGPESTLVVTGSTFADNPQGHVAALGEGTSVDINQSTFRGVIDAACISVSTTVGGAVVIADNQISGCAGTGVSLIDLEAATVSGNQISDIGPDPLFPDLAEGLTAIDTVADVTGNTISDAGGNAISGIRAVLTASNNVIDNTGAPAISLIDPGTAASTVTGNQITAATGAGVLVINAAATVESNTIASTAISSDNLGDGIAFAGGADVEVIDNTTTGNATNGIVFLDGALGSISGNTASGNAQFGILELCNGAANSVTVGANTLSNNGSGDQSLCSM